MNHASIDHGRTWRLAAPIILSNLSVPLVGAVDTAVVGHLPSPDSIAAVALGASIFSFLFWGFGFLRMGTTGFVAQAYGRGDTQQIAATLLRALILATLLSAVLILSQRLLSWGAFQMLEGSAQVETLARAYFDTRIWSAPATLVNYAVLGVLIGTQRTGTALVLQLVLNGANVALDLLFVLRLDLGVSGVALASVMSDYLAAVAGLWILTAHHGWHRLLPRTALWLETGPMLALLRVNLDIFVRTLCIIFAFFYFTVESSRLGTLLLAANAVLMHLQQFLAYGLDGFAHAAEALVGEAYGRRDRVAFENAIRSTTLWALIIAAAYVALYLLLGNAILGLLTSIDTVRETADRYLPWLLVSPLLSVWSFQLDGIFVGATRSAEMRNSMIGSLIVYLAAILVLVPLLGNHGLWLALMILMVARAATLGAYLPGLLRRLG
jgi:MATE family multidrug resistance protein